MTLAERGQMATENNEFRQRVQVATIIAASDVAASAQSTEAQRSKAQRIINSIGASWINAMAFLVVSNPAINENSTDNDIQFTVNQNFDKLQ